MTFRIVIAGALAALGATVAADSSEERSVDAKFFIEFGVDVGEFARDRECDDPRFENTTSYSAMASRPRPEALFHDAKDCRTAFEKGLIAPRTTFGDLVFSYDRRMELKEQSEFVYSAPCSDPRFEGPEVSLVSDTATSLEEDASLKCLAAFLSGAAIPKNWIEGQVFYFGFDAGEYAHDNECDDPRFEGADVALALSRGNIGRDAYDCKHGRVEPTIISGNGFSDFGNNSSRHAYDGECDDTRFEGPGMSGLTSNKYVGRDAMDCYRSYIYGDIELKKQ